MESYRTLVNLPDELILHIFDFFDINSESVEAAYNLALTSKRLHEIFLPIFLSHFHITDPEIHSEIVFLEHENFNHPDALSGIAISFTTSIQSLVCRFLLPRGEREVDMVIMHLRRLYFLVSSLESLDSVTLVFAEGESSECGCCLGFKVGETLDWMLGQWSSAMERTLSKIIEKGCQELVICGGVYMIHSYDFRDPTRKFKPIKSKKEKPKKGGFKKLKRLFKTKEKKSKHSSSMMQQSSEYEDDLPDLLQGEKWEFVRATGTGKGIVLSGLSKIAGATGSLRHLTIQSSRMMLVPPLLQLLLQILRMPSLESITIMNLSLKRLGPTLFTLIAQYAGAHIQHLNLSGLRKLDDTHIVNFICCLPNLVSLRLERDNPGAEVSNLGRFPDFPFLQSLHAPSRWVEALMESQRMGLASLESLEIDYKLDNGALQHWIRMPKALCLPMILNSNTGGHQRPLTVSANVWLGPNPALKMSQDIDRERAALTSDLLMGASCVVAGGFGKRIEGLDEMTLYFDDRISKTGIRIDEVLDEWVGLFTGLRELEVITIPPKGMDVNEARSMLEEIMQDGGLSYLESVSVNGVRVGPPTEVEHFSSPHQ